MSKNRACKSISFNKQDPIESQLLKHSLQHKGFSAYIKRLIQRDMEGGTTVPQQQMSPIVKSKQVTSDKPKILGFL